MAVCKCMPVNIVKLRIEVLSKMETRIIFYRLQIYSSSRADNMNYHPYRHVLYQTTLCLQMLQYLLLTQQSKGINTDHHIDYVSHLVT